MTKKKTQRKELPTLSQQIVDAIEGCGISNYELSKRTGVDRSRIHHAVKGTGWLSRESLDAIAKELRLKVTRSR